MTLNRFVTHTIAAVTLVSSSPLARPAAAQPASFASERDRRPFTVGERLTYNIRVGRLGKGTAVAQIKGVDTVRGTSVLHTIFNVNGSLLFFKVRDYYESWFDPRTFVSLRYRQQIDQGSYERNRTYEIFADRGVYLEPYKTERATVEKPLDDGAFLYFLIRGPFLLVHAMRISRRWRTIRGHRRELERWSRERIKQREASTEPDRAESAPPASRTV